MAGASGKPCYYAVLGVARDASAADIRAAFRKELQKWHPDKQQQQQGDSKATEEEARATFHLILEAYEMLSDAGRRTMQDGGVLFRFREMEWMTGVSLLFVVLSSYQVTVASLIYMMEPNLTRDEVVAMLREIHKGSSSSSSRSNAGTSGAGPQAAAQNAGGKQSAASSSSSSTTSCYSPFSRKG